MRVITAPNSQTTESELICSNIGKRKDLKSFSIRRLVERSKPSKFIYRKAFNHLHPEPGSAMTLFQGEKIWVGDQAGDAMTSHIHLSLMKRRKGESDLHAFLKKVGLAFLYNQNCFLIATEVYLSRRGQQKIHDLNNHNVIDVLGVGERHDQNGERINVLRGIEVKVFQGRTSRMGSCALDVTIIMFSHP